MQSVLLHILLSFENERESFHLEIVSSFSLKTLLCGLTVYITPDEMQNGIPYLLDSIIDYIPFDLV